MLPGEYTNTPQDGNRNMIRDLPDWTRQVTIIYEGGFIGLEELAARLGSIVPYDLRGNIVLMEDFESELTEWTDSSDVGCSTVRSSRHKFSGDWSVNLYYPSALGLKTSILSRYFHFPGTTKYAAFARFCWDTGSRQIWHGLIFENGETEFTILVDYDQGTSTLSIITTGGAYHNVDTALDLHPADYAWFPMLVTFDLASGYYDKLYVADKEYDISSVALYSTAYVAAPSGYVEIGVYQSSEGVRNTYIDDIIIAKNVP
jgi:hypothetical protein